MDRVVIVGAGLYGLIAAKTYLQINGEYDDTAETTKTTQFATHVPSYFTATKDTAKGTPGGVSFLVVDSAGDIGGTWGEDRLYPNLLSQNSYGLYEFSDLPLADVVPPDEEGSGKQFIAGWKINKYLHAWAEKWNLKSRIRLNWRVNSIRRLPSKEWQLNICITSDKNRELSIICDKLILATGLTSVPNFPQVASLPNGKRPASVIHAKDVGGWARNNLGYHALPDTDHSENRKLKKTSTSPELRSVAIYGGAKSSFDLVHLFARLHQYDSRVHLDVKTQEPVQVHWIIRENGTGPSWMAPPMSTLPSGEVVPSDKAASTRLLRYIDPLCSEVPKRLVFFKAPGAWFWRLRLEGSWWVRLLHANPLGRWVIRRFWDSFDRELVETAQYNEDLKMKMLKPDHSVVSCNSHIGIANQADLWETIRYTHVHTHRSTIESISSTGDGDKRMGVKLRNGVSLEGVELVVYATGYKPIIPIRFEPHSLRLCMGISDVLDEQSDLGSHHGEEYSGGESELDKDDPSFTIRIKHLKDIEQRSMQNIKRILTDNGCNLEHCNTPPEAGESQAVSYHLFRRMVAPELVTEGDRSFAALGIILTSTIAVVAEVQALWVAAFLTGALDHPRSHQLGSLQLNMVSREAMEESVANDVALGSVTGSGFQVEAIHYNDMLMRDLGLNAHRLGGGRWRELTGVYEPSAYRGIVHEWRSQQEEIE